MNAKIDRSIQPTSGPIPKINLKTPQTFSLDNGLEIIVVEDHKLPKITASLHIDNGPIAEGTKIGTSDFVGSLLGSGLEGMTKTAFDEEIDFLGASVFFDSEGAFASSLTKFFPRVFELMGSAAIHPKFTQEEFEKTRTRIIDGIKSTENNINVISNRLRKAIGYGKEHPYGEFKTKKTVSNITLQDVKKHYKKYYRPNNAYLVIVGDITITEAKKLVEKHFKTWEKSDIQSVTIPKPKNVNKTIINFIDMPNAVQSVVSVMNTTNLEMADTDYFAVLLANQILGGDFNSYLNMNLREKHGFTYGARSVINADKYASMFRTNVSVSNSVTSKAVIETMKEIKRIRTDKVTEEVLENVKAGYVGRFVMALEKPKTIANYALNSKIHNLPKDFYKTYLEKINTVTVEDILRVSKKHFYVDNTRIMVTGKAIDVLPNLEKLGYEITYYNTLAEKIEKP